jgi:hypothetical protein
MCDAALPPITFHLEGDGVFTREAVGGGACAKGATRCNRFLSMQNTCTCYSPSPSLSLSPTGPLIGPHRLGALTVYTNHCTTQQASLATALVSIRTSHVNVSLWSASSCSPLLGS